ncbi:MAG TPA: zinc metalloprotease HtpX [Actinocrinis sp.]|uniref:zinc metalloprotease HtpX n=1 Tax=Actinocrinis sp. TaxID=1920516 RepID=UPI002DDD8921|nr:zinc metalloprotease HtpX [Actinocrinis sp.]HEV3171044.1 zinc metalloprotease HtpX [Actinocrinis sp.]
MASTRFAPDRGLTSRMVFVMFLIGLLAVAFVVALIAFVPVRVLPVVLVIAGILLFCQFFFSDKIAAFAMGAHEVTPEQVPDLHGIIDRLCAMADMPKPRVAVAETPMLNAFATGRNPNNAVVCVTTGLLDRYRSGLITEQELEGILAHELSHVAHRDVMVMTIASFLGILAGLVARMAFWFGLGGNERDDRDGGVPVQLIILLVSIVVYAVSFLLTMALSRYRELAADRAGALLTGNPSALASALQKVTGDMARIPTQDLRQAEPFNAFYFAPAFNAESARNALSSHPTLQKRLENLAQISQQLGR